jgi:hypothetical protein
MPAQLSHSTTSYAERASVRMRMGRTYAKIDVDQTPARSPYDYAQVSHVPSRTVKYSLAVLAALFLLLRPLCDVWAAGHAHAEAGSAVQSSALEDTHGAGPHDGGSCCASLGNAILANPSDAGPIAAASDAHAAIAVGAWSPAAYVATAMPLLLKPSGVPPPSLSYYARSARILR